MGSFMEYHGNICGKSREYSWDIMEISLENNGKSNGVSMEYFQSWEYSLGYVISIIGIFIGMNRKVMDIRFPQ